MQFKNPEDFHNKLGFIFHALLALPLIAFIYLFLEIRNRNFQATIEDERTALVLIAVFLFIGIIDVALGYFLFKKNLKRIDHTALLKTKLSAYFTSSLLFYAFIEGASILMILGLYLTTSSAFIVAYMFILLLLSLNRPTPQKYVSDLSLNGAERDIILNKKEFEEPQEGG